MAGEEEEFADGSPEVGDGSVGGAAEDSAAAAPAGAQPEAGSVDAAEASGADAPEGGGSGVGGGEAGEAEAIAADPLEEAMASIATLEDELARARADVYNLTQEYNGYVKRSKADGLARYEEGIAKVAETLLSVLDDAELARQHEDLTGTAGRIVEKLEQTLATNFHVERFGAQGDAFDPQIHEALMHSTSPEVQAEQIGTLIQPGYRMGERLLRPARVGVVSPE